MDKTQENLYALSDAEKIEAFDMLAKRFYFRNFGRTPKSDFDVLMFSFFLEHCFRAKLDQDDHTLAVHLGISEAKVRSLKVSKQLQYPRESFDWRIEFCKAIPNARYDDKIYKVIVPVIDPNVRREIEAYIDKKGWYSEYQLNSKLLQMRPDQFIALCVSMAEETDGIQKIDPRQLAIRLQDEKISETLKPEGFVEKWNNKGPKAALSEILEKAPQAAVKAVLSNLPFSSVWEKMIGEFLENLMD